MSLLGSWRKPRDEVRRLHHWAVASATTVDGVRARVTVDYTLRIEDNPDADLVVLDDLIENSLRGLIAVTSVAGLPAPGVVPDWQVALPDGVVIESAVVTTADVEVSAELRRLVTSGIDTAG